MVKFLKKYKLNLMASIYFIFGLIVSFYGTLERLNFPISGYGRFIDILDIVLYGLIVVFLIIQKRLPIIILVGILAIQNIVDLISILIQLTNHEYSSFNSDVIVFYTIILAIINVMLNVSIVWILVLTLKKSTLITRTWFIPSIVFSLRPIVLMIKYIGDTNLNGIIVTTLLFSVFIVSLAAFGLWNKKYVKNKNEIDKYTALLKNGAITQEEFDVLEAKLK